MISVHINDFHSGVQKSSLAKFSLISKQIKRNIESGEERFLKVRASLNVKTEGKGFGKSRIQQEQSHMQHENSRRVASKVQIICHV